jgi:excisionase family DNA binding protein
MQQQLPIDEPPQLEWPSPLMTAAEVAAVLRITPKTVRQHIRRGRLRAIRIDGTGPYRVRAADAQAWAESQLVEPDAGALAVDRWVTSGRRRRAGVIGS